MSVVVASEEEVQKPSIATVGEHVSDVNVSIGPQFLQLFSEQLYSSPNKAFEELVSNSWDAGATAVYIGMASDLDSPRAAVWVLDDGESMDDEGINLLWKVAYSTKPTRQAARPQIGKFGIGKLSTYLLAHQLTYVCRAADGIIRAVTLDYRDIGRAGEGLHIEQFPLGVRKVGEGDLDALLADVDGREEILSLIRNGVPQAQTDDADEFGPGDGGGMETPTTFGTWTLVVLTDLKDAGRAMQVGRIRRMLRTALPLGSSVSIVYSGEPLTSVKLDLPIQVDWAIGPGLGIETVELPVVDGEPQVIAVEEHSLPYPHLTIEGIDGRITGTVRLFEQSISGGKSSAVAASNGFFVNVVGRVVNVGDPYFGLSNLNHSAWAKMRAAARADGLNHAISVDRESVLEERPVAVFRALLRAIFNKVRATHDAAEHASWPDAGAVLKKAWGTVPLKPLRRVLDERLVEGGEPPPFVDLDQGGSATAVEQWQQAPSDSDVVRDITFVDAGPDAPLVRYDVGDRTVMVNSDHPFAREHTGTHEEQVLLRDAAFVDLLTQAYMIELGVYDDTIAQIETYRDQLLRLVARISRRSGAQLAELLDAVTNDAKALERAVTEALEYLGFVVEYISGSGEPEGVAEAPLTTGGRARRRYTFTYDAKSSKSGRVANGDVRVSGLLRHKENHGADHVLVVAPDFERGALDQECEQHKITPIRASDLSQLLLFQATLGPIDLERFRGVFDCYDPDIVHSFIEDLGAEMRQQERLSFDVFFDALSTIGYQEPDTLTTEVIAREIRSATSNGQFPKKQDVGRIVDGLSVLVPHLIRANGHQVFLGAEPAILRDAVVRLLARVADRYGIDKMASS